MTTSISESAPQAEVTFPPRAEVITYLVTDSEQRG